MKTLDYKTYVSDPEIGRAIEREAIRARNEAIARFIVMPLVKAGGMLLRRAMQALLPILTPASSRSNSPGRIPGSELTCNNQPRS